MRVYVDSGDSLLPPTVLESFTTFSTFQYIYIVVSSVVCKQEGMRVKCVCVCWTHNVTSAISESPIFSATVNSCLRGTTGSSCWIARLSFVSPPSSSNNPNTPPTRTHTYAHWVVSALCSETKIQLSPSAFWMKTFRSEVKLSGESIGRVRLFWVVWLSLWILDSSWVNSLTRPDLTHRLHKLSRN